MSGRLVVVGGAPATGKTTLARELGVVLGLPVITKDDIKEALAAPFATGDRDWSKQLGVAAYSALYAVAERILTAGQGLILESNFWHPDSEAALRALARLAPTVVIVCRTTDALRRQRFEERAARGRHRVHVDSAILAEWSADDAKFQIDVGVPRLVVDTSDGYTPALEHVSLFARSASVPRA
jgi:predicted kinase